MEHFWAFSWVWIPIVAILVGGFTEWLKFKEKTRQLGSSAEELEQTVEAQAKALEASDAERAALVKRIQNLEAIVTSQLWDVLHDDTLAPPGRERALAEAHLHLDAPEEPSDADQVERLARRLKN